jgi:L-ascorbate metabolism protein UlaG (beta-lactamase superfamily)
MTTARRTDPALELEALPPIDFVLLSHMHEDHFDREVERKLDRSLPIITTPHAAADLTSKGFRAAKALNTWEPLIVTKGGRSGPGPGDAWRARARSCRQNAAASDGEPG